MIGDIVILELYEIIQTLIQKSNVIRLMASDLNDAVSIPMDHCILLHLPEGWQRVKLNLL